MTLPSALRQGINASDWNMYPAERLIPESDAPCTRTSPDEGFSKPAATLSSVDLPQPVGPTTDTNSPSAIESETSFTAVYDPRAPAKVHVIRSSSTAAITLPVLRVGLPDERIVECRAEVDLARGHHRRLELRQDLVDVLGRLQRHLAVLGVADHVLEQALLVERRVAGLELGGH